MTMVYQPAPSSKALGKRPAKNGNSISRNGRNTHLTPPLTPNGDSASSTHSTVIPAGETRQKRTLPTRTRRGGPGVGSCDIDLNIIETLKRTGENDPLIPTSSVFILTTDVNLIPTASSSDLGLNHFANERYFDKPEVIKSYREQQEIQTPEYTQLQDDAMVGGRLRARGEIDSAEMSDAAYEKRHRKYEAFERRQRLREKEKLQYEHYKLKERIEQLRNLDYTAFLAVPEDTFGEAPPQTNHVDEDAEVSPVQASMEEGERRRDLMLEVALSLEERYRTLLPSDRKGAEKKGERASLSVSVEPRTRAQSENDSSNWLEPVYHHRLPLRQPEPEPAPRPIAAPIPSPVPVPPPIPEIVPTPTPSPVPVLVATPLLPPAPIVLPEPVLPIVAPPTTESPVPNESISTTIEKTVKLKITLRPSKKQPSSTRESSPQSKRIDKKHAAAPPDAATEAVIQPNIPIPEPTRPTPALRPESPLETRAINMPINDTTPVALSLSRPPSFMGSLDPTSPNHHYQVLRLGSSIVDSSLSSAPTRKRPKLKARQDTNEPQVLTFVADPNSGVNTEVPVQVEQVVPQVIMPDSPGRRSTSPMSSRHENVSASSGRKQHMPVILVAASHNVGPEGRKTSRAVLAFGVKVPQFIPSEFELPQWLHDTDGDSVNDEPSDLEQQASLSLMMLHNGN